MLYCQIKLSTTPYNRDKFFYFIRQAIEYQHSDFLYHINRHLGEDIYDNEEEFSVFNDNFPIEKVISEIKKCLTSSKKFSFGFIEDTYFFKYDECGKYNSKTTNFFKVVTFQDSEDIITMYPIIDCEKLPYVDLNYMKVESNSKVKVLSQIDKFNKRFGIK